MLRSGTLPYRWVGWRPVRLLRRFLTAYFYRLLLAPWLRRFIVEGAAAIPPGPVIYAAMHTSMADTPLILRALGKHSDRVVVTAARDFYFRRSRPVFGPFVALAFGAVPIDRTGLPRQSLNDAITWLRSGFSVVIYPQGAIPGTADNERRLHRGVALLARQSRCPVVPVRIVGAAGLLPAGIHWPRRATVRITFLPPILHGSEETTACFTARLVDCLFST
jgi:1-acyl-sn-glycerol-3-phosphate acyltransferase